MNRKMIRSIRRPGKREREYFEEYANAGGAKKFGMNQQVRMPVRNYCRISTVSSDGILRPVRARHRRFKRSLT